MARPLRSWVEVDLDAIAHNSREITDRVAPALLCAVVKANGYGHGALEVALAAIAGGARCLAVAHVSEGVELRQAGIEVPILVLIEPTADEMSELVGHRLTPAIYSRRGVEDLSNAADANSYECHVEIDTGMHRSGVSPEDALEFRDLIATKNNLVVSGLFTHYANADTDHGSNAAQVQKFTSVVQQWGVDEHMILHASNSAAMLAGIGSSYQMVRLGTLVYGLENEEYALPEWARTALSVKSKVGFVQRLKAGESISYGYNYRLERDSNIATVPFGFADGLPSAASVNGMRVLINGKAHPIAGTVTMDQVMVDCGDEPVGVGDEVVICGRQGDLALEVDSQVKKMGLSALEFVTRLGARHPRVYTGQLVERLGLQERQ